MYSEYYTELRYVLYTILSSAREYCLALSAGAPTTTTTNDDDDVAGDGAQSATCFGRFKGVY